MKGKFVRKSISFITFLIIIITIAIPAYSFDKEKQLELMEAYLFVTGQSKDIPSMALGDDGETYLPLKCGTPIVTDFIMRFDDFDKELLKSMGLDDRPQRPVLDGEETFGSLDGLFLIHYTRIGNDSVYQASIDIDLNGTPDYVDALADICDSVYNKMINVMGYPTPPVDGFYPDGGDDRYDIYLKNLGGAIYGCVFVDSLYIDGPGTLRATSFMELDRDYQMISTYKDRPLDAVRVTAAHEFFHSVQFGMDVTETEYNPRGDITARYWMEMSAVWMEEQIYDDINDYRYYLPYYFDDPRNSIQQFRSYGDYHPYASAIFPMFLSEKYGQDIIRDIWVRCAETGGSDFLASAHLAIDSISGGTENWASAFAEFGVWNYFTGSKAIYAPPGIGYEERQFFPQFPDSMMRFHDVYNPSIKVFPEQNPLKPRHNAAEYVTFHRPKLIKGIDTIYYDCERYICVDSTEVQGWENPDMRYIDTITCKRSYWICNDDTGDVCMDSVLLESSEQGYDYMKVDSLFDLWFTLGDGICNGLDKFPLPWGVSFIFQWRHDTSLYSVAILPAPDDSTSYFYIPYPDSFQSITTVFTPATYIESYHNYNNPFYTIEVGYKVEKNLDEVDSAFISKSNAVLTPYPNPAIVKDLDPIEINFRFQVETDSLSYPIHGVEYSGQDPYIVLDIYNIAGERVKTLEGFDLRHPHASVFIKNWDLKSEAEKPVSSGIYIVYARMYSSEKRGALLAEAHSKVAVIR